MQTTCAGTRILNRQHKEDNVRYITVTSSSGQDDAAQKINASIRDHCREFMLQPNRGHEHLCLTTIGKFYFGKEEAMSACNVNKSNRRALLGIYHADLRRTHYNEHRNITTQCNY